MNNTKIKIIIIGICFLGLVIGPLAGYADSNEDYFYEESYDYVKSAEVPAQSAIRSDITLKKINSQYNTLGSDTQITSSEFDESHPVIDVDYNGNPLLLYHYREDFFSSAIYVQRSPDGGVSWPEESIYYWEWEDFSAVRPDINFVDGVRAIGTHEIDEQEPLLYIHDYENIEDPDTWALYYLDKSGSTSYVSETACAANKSGAIALGAIQDYEGDEYFEDTILISWDGNIYDDSDTYPGVYWLNKDANGNSIPYSNVCADAGDKIFFVFQRDPIDRPSQISAAFCRVDENTLYTDWSQFSVASNSQFNNTYPDVSVSGKTAYVAYMSDKDDNQDVYVASSTTGSFWRKYQVTSAPEDDLYPVIYADGEKVSVLFTRDENLYITNSEDSGKTWSTPEQINDEPNTVLQEYQNSDIAAKYGIWTDYRNGNNDLFLDEVGASAILTVDEIKGGFGVEATISNVGNAPAENIGWSIDLEGGILFIGAESSGTVNILPGESIKVKTDLILGIGRVSITATCADSKKTSSGFVLGPFVLGVG